MISLWKRGKIPARFHPFGIGRRSRSKPGDHSAHFFRHAMVVKVPHGFFRAPVHGARDLDPLLVPGDKRPGGGKPAGQKSFAGR